MVNNRIVKVVVFVALNLVALSSIANAAPALKELELSNDELTKMDRFERHTISKADQVYNKKQYRQAYAEYNAFITEFPRSKIIPYALFRKGRSIQLDDKRFQAIKDYQEILDFFPNDVKYATAALYYIGDCHETNGDIAKAVVTWAKLAEDIDYRKQPLAADAINYLASYLVKQKKEAEAAKYYRQIAIDFRKKNPTASDTARDAAIRFYVRVAPSEPELGKFYFEMKTFQRTPTTVTVKLSANKDYWDQVAVGHRHHTPYVRQHGAFADTEEDVKRRKLYYAYWSSQMQGKFASEFEYSDKFHIARANYQLAGDGNQAAWFQSLDAQYDRLQGTADWKRTVQWMLLYTGRQAKVEQYFKKINMSRLDKAGQIEVLYALWRTEETRPLVHNLIDKLPFGEFTNQELASHARHFYEEGHKLSAKFISRIDFAKMPGPETGSLAAHFYRLDKVIGQSIFRKILWNDMSDNEIVGVAHQFHRIDSEIVRTICGKTKDRMYGKFDLVSYYGSRHGGGWNPKAGLPLADELVKVDKYSIRASWLKAIFHDDLKEFSKAISAYQNCQNEPTNLFAIAECQKKAKKIESAVAQLREIENFFPKHGPSAAMRIAHYYKGAKIQPKYIKALRDVLKKYPDKPESRQAHEGLEAAGVKTGGGVDAS